MRHGIDKSMCYTTGKPYEKFLTIISALFPIILRKHIIFFVRP